MLDPPNISLIAHVFVLPLCNPKHIMYRDSAYIKQASGYHNRIPSSFLIHWPPIYRVIYFLEFVL